MSQIASGEFDVSLTPRELFTPDASKLLGRLTIAKQFRGDLTASSIGEMLSAMTGVKGSAGYVAIERVTGTLHGRSGTFVLQHSGIMTRGAPGLSVQVVPDSGTDELTGLAGTMQIVIEAGRHSYVLSYELG